ncbi:ABC transporter ATP-binding protein [Pseudomonas syringae pv. aptata]|uniref:ABC transporter ATP-binding protein n=1 Tax=Pseudomonas syringae pv. aptata TaxID=83167 RepID=A0A3M3X7Z6_PSEAP|nr:ABC transporter ATP-binding protein [Pseudomonas syringae pv. aptata]
MANLSIRNLQKGFDGHQIIKGIDLDVKDREFVVFVGPSGCGKSTLLRLIAGLEEVTSGTIELDGRDITQVTPAKRDLAMVFQTYALYPHMTVGKNLSFALDLAGGDKAEIKKKVDEAARILELGPLLERKPKQLSGGQRQRVAIGRAIVRNPKIFLFDEPLSNLDANLREEMQFEIRRIQNEVGITTLMVTHDQAEALSISDRVVVMQSGRITQIDEPYKLYEHPRTRFISGFVGKANMLQGDLDSSGIPQIRQVPGDGSLTLSLRPEKIDLVAPGCGRLSGRIVTRYFLGSQWLYRIQTGIGEVTVVRRNDGQVPLEQGAAVDMDWPTELLRVLDADEVRA